MPYSSRRTAWWFAIAIAATLTSACSRSAAAPDGPKSVRLVDAFDHKLVEGSPSTPATPAPRTEWRFDGAPSRPPAAPSGAGPAPSPRPFAATRGWEAGPGVSGLAIRNGLLVGRTTNDFPILRIERTTGLENPDQLQAVEIRMRASGGANVSAVTRATPPPDIKLQPSPANRV